MTVSQLIAQASAFPGTAHVYGPGGADLVSVGSAEGADWIVLAFEPPPSPSSEVAQTEGPIGGI